MLATRVGKVEPLVTIDVSMCAEVLSERGGHTYRFNGRSRYLGVVRDTGSSLGRCSFFRLEPKFVVGRESPRRVIGGLCICASGSHILLKHEMWRPPPIAA